MARFCFKVVVECEDEYQATEAIGSRIYVNDPSLGFDYEIYIDEPGWGHGNHNDTQTIIKVGKEQ